MWLRDDENKDVCYLLAVLAREWLILIVDSRGVSGQFVALLEALFAELAGEGLVVVVHTHHVHAQLVRTVARVWTEGTAVDKSETNCEESSLNDVPQYWTILDPLPPSTRFFY